MEEKIITTEKLTSLGFKLVERKYKSFYGKYVESLMLVDNSGVEYEEFEIYKTFGNNADEIEKAIKRAEAYCLSMCMNAGLITPNEYATMKSGEEN